MSGVLVLNLSMCCCHGLNLKIYDLIFCPWLKLLTMANNTIHCLFCCCCCQIVLELFSLACIEIKNFVPLKNSQWIVEFLMFWRTCLSQKTDVQKSRDENVSLVQAHQAEIEVKSLFYHVLSTKQDMISHVFYCINLYFILRQFPFVYSFSDVATNIFYKICFIIILLIILQNLSFFILLIRSIKENNGLWLACLHLTMTGCTCYGGGLKEKETCIFFLMNYL